MTASAAARVGKAPARPAIRLQYASFESRVAAATLDLFVLCIISSLLVTAGALVILVSSDFERADASTMSLNIFWVCTGAIAPVALLYLFISLAWKGQTIGLAIMQLMVVRTDGRHLGFVGAIVRMLGLALYAAILAAGGVVAFIFKDSTGIAAGAIGGAIVLCLVGIVMAAYDPRRQTLHDRLAGTFVVRLV